MGFKRDVIEKLDKVQEKQNVHTTELALYNQLLKEHMRRTDIAEKNIDLVKERVAPIEQHVLFINKASKWIISVVALIASASAAYHYLFLK